MRSKIIISLFLTVALISFSTTGLAMEEGQDYFSYEGTGDDYFAIEKPDEIAVMKIIGNSSGSHFAVAGYDADGNQTDLFVNTTSYYDGLVALDFDYLRSGQDTTHLEVNASGDWNVGVFPIGAADWVDVPGEISGEGDNVIILDRSENNPSLARITGNQNSNHFAVVGWHEESGWPSRADLLINTTQSYEGTVRLDPATMILEVTAADDWVISVE